MVAGFKACHRVAVCLSGIIRRHDERDCRLFAAQNDVIKFAPAVLAAMRTNYFVSVAHLLCDEMPQTGVLSFEIAEQKAEMPNRETIVNGAMQMVAESDVQDSLRPIGKRQVGFGTDNRVRSFSAFK